MAFFFTVFRAQNINLYTNTQTLRQQPWTMMLLTQDDTEQEKWTKVQGENYTQLRHGYIMDISLHMAEFTYTKNLRT